MFHDCPNLSLISIGSEVEAIRTAAFYGCKNLSVIDYGEKIKSIESDAFSKCESLPTIDLPVSVQYIGSRAFSDSALKHITIRNANCVISQDAISIYATIHGYAGSTAEQFADEYGYFFEELDPHDHVFGEWEYDGRSKDDYCTAIYARYCAVCGLRETKTEEMHDYYEYSRTGSCTEGGTIVYRCKYCGTTKTENLPATGHDYNSRVIGLCTEPHSVSYECKYCGYNYKEPEDATEHTFGEPKRNTSCGGVIDTYTCTRCGYSYQDVITEPNHDFVEDKRSEPTCGKDGFVNYICRTCGYFKKDILPATGEHEFVQDDYYKWFSDTEHIQGFRCSR